MVGPRLHSGCRICRHRSSSLRCNRTATAATALRRLRLGQCLRKRSLACTKTPVRRNVPSGPLLTANKRGSAISTCTNQFNKGRLHRGEPQADLGIIGALPRLKCSGSRRTGLRGGNQRGRLRDAAQGASGRRSGLHRGRRRSRRNNDRTPLQVRSHFKQKEGGPTPHGCLSQNGYG